MEVFFFWGGGGGGAMWATSKRKSKFSKFLSTCFVPLSIMLLPLFDLKGMFYLSEAVILKTYRFNKC